MTIRTELAAAITSLRERATRAQEKGVNLYRRLGYSEAEIEEDRPTWAVIVQSGDILRILDALEKTK